MWWSFLSSIYALQFKNTFKGDHSVPCHHPEVVNGISWYKIDHFVIDYCTSLVASDCSLVLGDGREIPYKNYWQAGREYAKWSLSLQIKATRKISQKIYRYRWNSWCMEQKSQNRMCLMTWKKINTQWPQKSPSIWTKEAHDRNNPKTPPTQNENLPYMDFFK